MLPKHFDDYCVVKGMFYNSDRFSKSIQHRVMKFSEHVYNYPTYEVIAVCDDENKLIRVADRLNEILKSREDWERAKARKQAWYGKLVNGEWIETPAWE